MTKLYKNDNIGELHFKQEEVLRQWVILLTNGDVNKVDKEMVSLKKGSIPSIFPAEVRSDISKVF